jgi:hypothetical protein
LPSGFTGLLCSSPFYGEEDGWSTALIETVTIQVRF